MITDFEKLREKLHESIEINGLNSEQTRKISKKYDDLINSYYQHEKQYKKNSLMQDNYRESTKCLKKITKDFSKFPTVKEWNFYAKQNDLLNSESLKYISGSTWHELRSKIMSDL